jgi:hypothetical protein
MDVNNFKSAPLPNELDNCQQRPVRTLRSAVFLAFNVVLGGIMAVVLILEYRGYRTEAAIVLLAGAVVVVAGGCCMAISTAGCMLRRLSRWLGR